MFRNSALYAVLFFKLLTIPSSGYSIRKFSDNTSLWYLLLFISIICHYHVLVELQGSQSSRAALHQRVFLKGMQSMREHLGAGPHASCMLQACGTSHRCSRAEWLCYCSAQGRLTGGQGEYLRAWVKQLHDFLRLTNCRTRALESGLNSNSFPWFAGRAVSYLI